MHLGPPERLLPRVGGGLRPPRLRLPGPPHAALRVFRGAQRSQWILVRTVHLFFIFFVNFFFFIFFVHLIIYAALRVLRGA